MNCTDCSCIVHKSYSNKACVAIFDMYYQHQRMCASRSLILQSVVVPPLYLHEKCHLALEEAKKETFNLMAQRRKFL